MQFCIKTAVQTVVTRHCELFSDMLWERISGFYCTVCILRLSGKSWKLNIFRFCENMCYYLDAFLIKFFLVLSFYFISRTYPADFYLWTRATLAGQQGRFTSRLFLEREFLTSVFDTPCQYSSLLSICVLLRRSELNSI